AIPNSPNGNPTLTSGPGWGTTSWAGCVDARAGGEDVNDDPPSTGTTSTLFNQYYWPSDNLSYGNPYNNTPNGNANKWASIEWNKCVPTYNRCKNGTCTLSSPTCSTSNGHTCTYLGLTTCSVSTSCTQSSSTSCNQVAAPNGYSFSSTLDTSHQG